MFDSSALSRNEEHYRQTLQSEPEDTASRLNLAWCLFLHAFQERVQNGTTPAAERLLADSLHETAVVRQLSLRTEEQAETERIQFLTSLLFGEEAVKESLKVAQMILVKVTQELLHPPANGDAVVRQKRTIRSRRKV